ncbi:MAG: histidine kinase [Mesoflavibacter sp.]|nr:histidine kinase [Mesoflavibacter sp.]
MFSTFLMPTTIATTYVSIYKLIPDYLITKRYTAFTVYSVYTLIISLYLIMLSIFFSLIYLSNFEFDQMNPITRNIILVTSSVYLVVILVSAFKLLQLNLKSNKKTALLESKILETQLKLKEQELNYLKMQIHPHFLFNTLNTMYGAALKKADDTPNMILKLSNLLDYLLYQVDKPFVSLEDEINHIEDYISLEKMRFNETLNVSFTKDIHSNTISIAPMLFIPFVENSFKHGTLKNGVLHIDLSIKTTSEIIIFKISNSSLNKKKQNEGIGLQNIKKRLELLYPNQYQLDIFQEPSKFTVNLQLNIKSKLTNE